MMTLGLFVWTFTEVVRAVFFAIVAGLVALWLLAAGVCLLAEWWEVKWRRIKRRFG